MISSLGKIPWILCFFAFSFSLLAESELTEKPPAANSYWEFQNSVLYQNLKSKRENEVISHMAFETGLSYVRMFSFFSLHFDFFLALGPYTSFNKKKEHLDVTFLGFGGRVGLKRELGFIPGMKHFSLGSSLRVSQIKSSSSGEKILEIETSSHALKVGNIRDYKLKIRSFALDLALSYHFGESFRTLLERDPETGAYGHSLSLVLSWPFYSKWKERYYEATGSSTVQFKSVSEKGKGVSVALAYHLAFL